MMLLFILWATSVDPLATLTADSCYADNTNPYVMFSTYTPYEFVHENADDPVYIPREYCFHNFVFLRLYEVDVSGHVSVT